MADSNSNHETIKSYITPTYTRKTIMVNPLTKTKKAFTHIEKMILVKVLKIHHKNKKILSVYQNTNYDKIKINLNESKPKQVKIVKQTVITQTIDYKQVLKYEKKLTSKMFNVLLNCIESNRQPRGDKQLKRIYNKLKTTPKRIQRVAKPKL